MRLAVLLFYLVPLAIAAFLATLASASIGSLSGWGFPLQWKIGGCTQINGTLVCAAEYDDWLFFGVDALFYTLVGYVLLYVIDKLLPGRVERVATLRPRIILFIVLIASSLTLATGWLASEQFFTPAGVGGVSYGFPFAWKTTLASCPPPCLQANGTRYDWVSLIGDLLFYMTGAFGILLYTLRSPNTHLLKTILESRRVLSILTLTVIALSAGNYAYDSVYGTGNNWTGCGRFEIDHYNFQNTNSLTVWVKDYGPGTATLISLYIKNSNGSGPVASYQLQVTIDEGALGSISENTTSQGLQLTQNSTYSLQIVNACNTEWTFSVTWT